MNDDDTVVRVVTRVSDMIGPPAPGSVVRSCSRCLRPSYLALAQPVPAGMEDAVLACVPCGLRDPEIAPELIKTARAVAALGRVLPPAERMTW